MLIIISFGLIGVIVLSFASLSYWRYKCGQLLPGKKLSIFNIFGDIIEAIPSMNSGVKCALHMKILDILRHQSETFRQKQLFSCWIFYTPFILIVKAGAVKEMLKGNNLKEKSWIYESFKPLFGNSILISPYDLWKPRRKLLNRCFYPEVLRGFLPVFNDHARKLVKFFEGGEKEFFDVTYTLKLCALDILCETVFDIKLEALGNEESQYFKSIERTAEIFMERIYKFWQWPDFVFWNTPSGRELKFHVKLIKDFTKNVIREKKKQYVATGNDIDKGKHQTLVDVLLHMLLVTHELSEEDVESEANTFVMGGHDTVAISISWALYEIGRSPEVQRKIHEELDRVFGRDVHKEATEDDLSQLLYLDCVIKESHRLYPPVPLFGRKVEKDTKILEHTIPKGASCFVLAYFLHRDEEVYPDPEKFDPDRFLPENSKKIPEFAYIPFSGGPRNCIGYRYGIMEIKVLLSSIFRNFSVQYLDESIKIQPLMHIALHPSRPIYMGFEPRNKD